MMSNYVCWRAALVVLPLIASGMAVTAQAQTVAQQSPSPMAKSPMMASGAASAANPDNMPVKKPSKPTDDQMIRAHPASEAKAK
jgi:hypothetical protein